LQAYAQAAAPAPPAAQAEPVLKKQA